MCLFCLCVSYLGLNSIHGGANYEFLRQNINSSINNDLYYASIEEITLSIV